MLANRVRKNQKHLRKWAKRNAVQCYRIYDRDIPEIPLAIDWYDGRLYIAEYVRHKKDADSRPEQWLETMVLAAGEVLEIAPSQVYLKQRARQRGKSQYEKTGRSQQRFTVEEGGLKFWVNLTDYLDTGLFLDHRQTRNMVREMVPEKHFLNLFCYTGAFSVYAASGGAASTTSVDLSSTYLEWTRRNLELNGLFQKKHEVIRADVASFLYEATPRGRRYDIAFVDPPTFSNSKRTEKVFDIQRDHGPMLAGLKKLMKPDGIVLFSTNSRRFRLELEAEDWTEVEEITNRTVPEDFKQKRPHRCWRLRCE